MKYWRALRIWSRALVCAAFWVFSTVAGAAAPADARIGVAAFEASGPPGAEIPDVATLLADRIGTLGVGKIVGPSAFGTVANAAPSNADVVRLAKREVDVVVVGRTTRIGTQLSIDVKLRSGVTGKPIDAYVAEVSTPAQLAIKIDELADQVVDGTVTLLASNVSAKPVAAKPRSSSKPVAKRRPFDSGKPISIKSKTLEAVDNDGRRRLVFTGNVRVSQDDVRMTSNSLTAEYPAGESQPSLMIARGSVRVTQNGQEALCDTGTYKRNEEMLLCCGHAELRDGPNRVHGKCIEFDLNGETIRVQDASINIFPEPESTDGTSGGADEQ